MHVPGRRPANERAGHSISVTYQRHPSTMLREKLKNLWKLRHEKRIKENKN